MTRPLLLFYTLIILFVLDSNETRTISTKSTIGSRIIGGEDAFAGQFPAAAAIHVQTRNSRFFCGGALLNRQWLLTAAHCANDAVLFTIQLGSHILDDPLARVFATSDYILHPDFNAETIDNDIGLITLREPLNYNIYIQPIFLPTENFINDTDLKAIGWGQKSDAVGDLSQHLQYITAAVLTNQECKLFYGNQITDNMVCVEGNFNQGTCTGDNGSPLVRYAELVYWVEGVASFISGNGCESTEPSGYARTYPYADWIREQIGTEI